MAHFILILLKLKNWDTVMDHWTKENSHNKKKKNLDTLDALDRCVQSLGALRDPLHSRCSAGKHMQRINEDLWACGPWLGISWCPLDWASAPSPQVVRSLIQTKLTVRPIVCKAAGERHPPGQTPATQRLTARTGCDQDSGFSDYTINVSACTPGPLWPGRNPTPQLLKRPDPSARTLHS